MSRKVDVYHVWKDIWDDNKGEEENKYQHANHNDK